MINIYTIGFTKRSAEDFFSSIKNRGIVSVIDTRINNTSQLSGFAKKDDLKYFLYEIDNVGYEHVPELAPTDDLLKSYRKKEIPWSVYEREYILLLKKRDILSRFPAEYFNNKVILCSENTPEYCHRRLLAEYLSENSDKIVQVWHL